MNKILALLFLVSLILPSNAKAAPVVADLSNYRIAMDSSFNGTRLFLFGTRNDNGDIVVIIRGENKNYIIRKKEKVAGIWINRDRMKFYNVPNFYAVASSKPMEEIGQNSIFNKLGIGEKNLINIQADNKQPEQIAEFRTAFLDHHHNNHLYYTNPENISFMGESLFKTVIEFSDNIPSGTYTAEIYLVNDSGIIGMQSIPISVIKSGLDAFIYNHAHNSPALYGLSAIALALAAGWIAGKLFEARA